MTTQVTDKKLDELNAMRDLVDQYGAELEDLQAKADAAKDALKAKEEAAAAIVKKFGVIPPNAEKSLRLTGATYSLTVSAGQSVEVDQEAAARVESTLKGLGAGRFFKKLFRRGIRYSIAEGAQQFLQELPKDVPAKIALPALFKSAVTIKTKKASFTWDRLAKKEVKSAK